MIKTAIVLLATLQMSGECCAEASGAWLVEDASSGDSKLWHTIGSQLGLSGDHLQYIGAGVSPEIVLYRIDSLHRESDNVIVCFSALDDKNIFGKLRLKRAGISAVGSITYTDKSSSMGDAKETSIDLKLRLIEAREFNRRWNFFSNQRNVEIANRKFDSLDKEKE